MRLDNRSIWSNRHPFLPLGLTTAKMTRPPQNQNHSTWTAIVSPFLTIYYGNQSRRTELSCLEFTFNNVLRLGFIYDDLPRFDSALTDLFHFGFVREFTPCNRLAPAQFARNGSLCSQSEKTKGASNDPFGAMTSFQLTGKKKGCLQRFSFSVDEKG